MCDRNDPNCVGRNLIENTVREPAKNIATSGTTEDRADMRIRQYSIYGAVKLGDECEAKLGI